MITLPELLEDPIYKKYFLTPPKLPKVPRINPPWRVYVQLEQGGPWSKSKRDFWKYSEAFAFLKPLLKEGRLHDGAIVCKPKSFAPPKKLVKIKGKFVTTSRGTREQATKYIYHFPPIPADEAHHTWCGYCRRPTVFKTYTKHHAFKHADAFAPFRRRCSICGASEEGMRRYA